MALRRFALPLLQFPSPLPTWPRCATSHRHFSAIVPPPISSTPVGAPTAAAAGAETATGSPPATTPVEEKKEVDTRWWWVPAPKTALIGSCIISVVAWIYRHFDSKGAAESAAADLISIERPEILDMVDASQITSQELLNFYWYLLRMEPTCQRLGTFLCVYTFRAEPCESRVKGTCPRRPGRGICRAAG